MDQNHKDVEAFHGRYFDLFLKKLRELVGDEAEELAQATLLKLLTKSHLHDPSQATYMTFAVRVARNLWFDGWRRRNTVVKHYPRLARPILQDDPFGEAWLIQREEDAIFNAVVAEAIKGLPPHERDVLRLRMAGIGRVGIARQLEMSVSTVNNWLNAAARKVRKKLMAAGFEIRLRKPKCPTP